MRSHRVSIVQIVRKINKSLFGRILSLLPSQLRNELIRSSIRLPSELSQGLVFKIAETTEELESSFKLVYESYLGLGYCKQNKLKMRATVYHALPTTTTLIAVDGGKVVGTLTIVRDNRLGLPLETVFDVETLRNNSSRLAEITSLVIHKDYRREKGGQILFPLLRLMYEYSTSCFGVNHLLIMVHPKDVHFYKSLLLFKEVSGTGVRDYLGAPAVSLHLDLQTAVHDYEKVYATRNAATDLFDFFVRRKIGNVILPQRRYNKINDPLVSLDYFKEFFQRQLKLGLAPVESRQIESYLLRKNSMRAEPRIEVEAPASFNFHRQDHQGQVRFVVKVVSRNGFRAYIREDFFVQSVHDIKIQIAPQIMAHVKAQIRYISPGCEVEFKILKDDLHWRSFINFLYEEQYGKVA